MSAPSPTLECPCAGAFEEPSFTYEAPPPGETLFQLSGEYQRAYHRCRLCGHFFARHALDLAGLYGGDYAGATYPDGMRAAFDRIMALPEGRSDNAGRVDRVMAFAEAYLPRLGRRPRLADLGAGLAVFPARMQAAGWDCTAIDPDPRAAEHARSICLAAFIADLRSMEGMPPGRFDAVTLNKVLEHLEAPVAVLRQAAALLEPHGFLYVEVPDGEAAAGDGPGREEFFIEHHHVFSPASLALTARRAGLSPLAVERLREPSGKFTLRGFLVPAAGPS